MAIYFYRVSEVPFGVFSNFSAHPFVLDDKLWPTSEHYFQAQKFVRHPEHQEEIRLASTPMESAEKGRDRHRPLRPDWAVVRDDAMRAALLAKFSAHPSLSELLLSTGDETLIEKTTGDYYWGCGSDGTGQNRLGQLLMELREALNGETHS